MLPLGFSGVAGINPEGNSRWRAASEDTENEMQISDDVEG